MLTRSGRAASCAAARPRRQRTAWRRSSRRRPGGRCREALLAVSVLRRRLDVGLEAAVRRRSAALARRPGAASATSKLPTPITLWALAGTLTVLAAGPLLPFAAMMTAPASKALSAATEMALRSLPLPCISATMTRSSTRTAFSKPRTAAVALRKPLQAPCGVRRARVDLPAVERDRRSRRGRRFPGARWR